MRPIADAVTEIQVQTGSTSAEYGAYLGVHVNVVTKSGTNKPARLRVPLPAGRVASTPAATSTTRPCPKNPRSQKQFGAELDGPLMIPGLYNGKNHTFFMVAYEGVRGDAIQSPFASVPTARMRRGDFSEITTPIRDPRTGQPFPGNIIPTEPARPDLARAPPVLPGAQPRGHRQQLPGTERRSTDNVDQFLGRVDQNLGNKARLSLRYNWHDSYSVNPFNAPIPVTGRDPAAHEQELAPRLHPHAHRTRCSTTSRSATTTSTSTR